MLSHFAGALATVSTALLMANLGAVEPTGDRAAQKKEAPAEILDPKEGQPVERLEYMRGRLKEQSSWAVVLVQPLLAGEAEPFYVQPPVTTIEKDGEFTAPVHFGNDQTPRNTRYRVVILVVKDKKTAAEFKSGMELKSLPADLPRSDFVTVVRGGKQQGEAKATKPRFIRFGGQVWQVRDSGGKKVGPGGNFFSPHKENVQDQSGQVRLAITKRDGHWHCAELIGPDLGYGTYTWVIAGNLASLDPQTVLGLFLYADADDSKEIDFELSRWSDPKKANGQFLIQPYESKAHRFETGKAEVLTCALTWGPKQVSGHCWIGEDTTRAPLTTWKFAGPRIPRSEDMLRVRMNWWLFGAQEPSSGDNQTVVIRSFRFTPAAN